MCDRTAVTLAGVASDIEEEPVAVRILIEFAQISLFRDKIKNKFRSFLSTIVVWNLIHGGVDIMTWKYFL